MYRYGSIITRQRLVWGPSILDCKYTIEVNTHTHHTLHSTHSTHHTEYAYGGHSYSYTGVYDIEPRRAAEVAAPGITFRESIRLGHTHLTASEVTELVLAVGREYNGNEYHIFNK